MLFIAVMSKLDFQHHYSSPRVSHDPFFFYLVLKKLFLILSMSKKHDFFFPGFCDE